MEEKYPANIKYLVTITNTTDTHVSSLAVW